MGSENVQEFNMRRFSEYERKMVVVSYSLVKSRMEIVIDHIPITIRPFRLYIFDYTTNFLQVLKQNQKKKQKQNQIRENRYLRWYKAGIVAGTKMCYKT